MAKDSRIAEIFRQELNKDKGLVSAYLSALGERGREKTDIRRILPQSGISGAISQRMFGKPYRASGPKGDGSSGIESKSLLTRISMNGEITAKNSLFLPQMAKDMNLMRQNIAKLVKSNGVIPATKASSAFFGARKAQEDSYESKFKKDSASKLTPTKVEEGEKPGIGSMLLGLVGEFFSGGLVSIMLKTLTLVGIGAFVKAMFEDEAFRTTISESVDGVMKAVFGENYWEKVNEVWEKVKTGALVVVGAIAGLYVAFNALSGVIFGLAAKWAMGGGIQGPPGLGGGVKGRKKIGGGILGLGLTAGGLYLSNKLANPSEEQIKGSTDNLDVPGATPTMSTSQKIGTGIETALGAQSLYSGVSSIKNLTKAGTTTADAILDAKTITQQSLSNSKPLTRWGRFLKYVATKSPLLFQKIGVKLAQATALAAIPLVGWIGALINIGLGLWTAWDLYELWEAFNNEQEESTTPTRVNTQNTTTANSTSPVAIPTTPTSPAATTTPTQTSPSAASTSPTPTGTSNDGVSSGSTQNGFGANSIQDIVPGGVFTSAFTPAKRPNHKGWDIAAPTGTPVKIPLAGNVTFAGATPGFGNHIEVDHGDGKKTTYSHLSKINVAQGQAVTPGQVIGAVGNTGESRGSHLHFGIKEGSQNIDPITFFKTKPRDTPDHQLAKQGNAAHTNVASNGTPSLLPGGLLSDNSSISKTSGGILDQAFELMGQMITGFAQPVPGNNSSGAQQQAQKTPQQIPNNSTTDAWSKESFELFFAQSTGTGNIRV